MADKIEQLVVARSKKNNLSAKSDNQEFRLMYPVLLGVELKRNATKGDNQQSEEVEYYYSVEIEKFEGEKPKDIEEDLTSVICRVVAGLRREKVIIYELDASYMVGAKGLSEKGGNKRFETFYEQLVSASVWPRFLDLFSTVSSQSMVEMPTLPPIPKIWWGEIESNSAEGVGG